MTFTTLSPANRPASAIFSLPLHRLSIAAFVVQELIAASRARRERRAIRQLARLDAHLLRDLGLDAGSLEAMADARHPTAPRAPF